ncbi:MAG TPA: zinc-dependent metalloprotease family protein [Thermoanaerobaculia bacterium]|nr:zinc-dependent metalloprotease family protein [Thermoanaerobaculia bacterium]
MKVGHDTKRLAVAGFAGTLAAGLLLAQPTLQPTIFARICFGDFVRIPELVEIGPIPVGCEIIDCCPGCPGPGPIDWRILVAGDPIESAVLTFEGLPPERARAIGIEGDARWLEGGQLRIGKGEVILKGLPGDARDRPPVGSMRLVVNRSLKGGPGDSADSGDEPPDAPKDAGSVEISIDQMLGRFVVNEYRLRYQVLWCWPFRPRDRIRLDNNASSDQAVVLLDANRTGGCVNDEIRRGSGLIGVGSVIANGTCRSEVAVFSDDDAMRLVPNVNVWTNSLGDLLPVDLTPNRLMAPLSVWVTRAGAAATAAADVANANLLYNANNAGIGFAVTTQDLSGNQNAVTTIGTGCANAAAVQASAFFTPNRLNVYYVDSAFTGVNCGLNRNIQYVGTTANNQTLAHEFGHSFTLGHTNGLAGFALANVMMGGGQNRTHFSEGQSFRMNANCFSTLNGNGVRAGPVRNCPDSLAGNCPAGTDAHCPALATDVTPK